MQVWFYGSIGNIMEGSGISKLFQTIYGENTTKHILSGKATAQANRAHIIAESALYIKFQELALNDATTTDSNAVDLEEIKNIYFEVPNKKTVSTFEPLKKMKEIMEEKINFA